MLALAHPAQAQMSNLDFSVHVGAAMPIGKVGDYFNAGPAFRVDVGRAFKNDMSLILDLGADHLSAQDATYVPRTNLWRYQIEVAKQLRGADSFSLMPYVGGGATVYRSAEYQNGLSPDHFDHTYPTGTVGTRLGLKASEGLTWYLSGELNWSPIAKADAQQLSDASRMNLPTFGSTTTGVVTLGFNLRP